jgi:hypothetical protein
MLYCNLLPNFIFELIILKSITELNFLNIFFVIFNRIMANKVFVLRGHGN